LDHIYGQLFKTLTSGTVDSTTGATNAFVAITNCNSKPSQMDHVELSDSFIFSISFTKIPTVMSRCDVLRLVHQGRNLFAFRFIPELEMKYRVRISSTLPIKEVELEW